MLNLVKTNEERQAEQEQAMQAQQMQSLTDQAGKIAGTPLMDPSKNPQILDAIEQAAPALQQPQ
jgi:TPP-dependent indolepyruvate ferredoxin oxidoreductase alpha subunit